MESSTPPVRWVRYRSDAVGSSTRIGRRSSSGSAPLGALHGEGKFGTYAGKMDLSFGAGDRPDRRGEHPQPKNKKRDDHLRSKEFFDVDELPRG